MVVSIARVASSTHTGVTTLATLRPPVAARCPTYAATVMPPEQAPPC